MTSLDNKSPTLAGNNIEMRCDCEEWRIAARKCSTRQKRQSGLSCEGKLRSQMNVSVQGF